MSNGDTFYVSNTGDIKFKKFNKDISLRYLLSSYLAVFMVILVIVIEFPFFMNVKNIMKNQIKKYLDHYSLINKGRFMGIYNLNEYSKLHLNYNKS